MARQPISTCTINDVLKRTWLLMRFTLPESRQISAKEDIRIEWNTSETKVGLFIKNELWAAFDAAGKKHGGNYESGARPNIPDAVAESFRTERGTSQSKRRSR